MTQPIEFIQLEVFFVAPKKNAPMPAHCHERQEVIPTPQQVNVPVPQSEFIAAAIGFACRQSRLGWRNNAAYLFNAAAPDAAPNMRDT